MHVFMYLKNYDKQSHFVHSIQGNKYLKDFKKLQVQRQGASSKNLFVLYIDPGYKKQVKCMLPQSVIRRHSRGSWPSVWSPTLSWLYNQRFLDKKMTAVATKPPLFSNAQCFKATISGTGPQWSFQYNLTLEVKSS